MCVGDRGSIILFSQKEREDEKEGSGGQRKKTLVRERERE